MINQSMVVDSLVKRGRDHLYYYCYYAVVVIMLCVLVYAVLRSVTGQVQFGEYPVPAKIALC